MPKATSRTRRSKTQSRRVFFSLVTTASLVTMFAAMLVVLILNHRDLPVVRAEAVASVENKLQQAKSAAGGNPHTVRLDEDEVNAWLRDRLNKNSDAARPDAVHVRDLRVRLIEDRIRAYIILGHGLTEVTVDLEGKLYSQQGLLQFIPVAGKVGSLPIPQTALITAMQQVMEKFEKQRRLRLPDSVADLRVEDGHVVLRYN